ncbi:MAG: VWA domain-containing protein [Polyangiaceae bacterium]
MLLGAVIVLAGCGSASTGGNTAKVPTADGKPIATDAAIIASDGPAKPNGVWIGAGAESEVLLAGSEETTLGVWVDAPRVKARVRTPVDLALVIDTSGSMQGAKIENARAAARAMVENLADGDIVSIDTFNDEAKPLVAPTALSSTTRASLLSQIAELKVGGSTNMFDGLALGEAHVARAPASHAVRRVVVISDGIANVGPSSPEALGQLAERGVRFHAQITSLGVGADYDERTLNALAVRSSGRLYHLSEPKEMTAMLKHELELLESTVASDSFVEVVPAPGVQLIGTDGMRSDMSSDGSLKIPLGALFGGQHKEALVRVRVRDGGSAEGTQNKPLASVRLHFRDPGEGDLERVQEVVAHVAWTSDASVVASHSNAKTKSIMAVQEAAKMEMQAAQQVNRGQFGEADKQLAAAQRKLDDEASATKDSSQRARLTAQSQGIVSARAATKAASAAPAAVQMNEAKKLNQSGMSEMGF